MDKDLYNRLKAIEESLGLLKEVGVAINRAADVLCDISEDIQGHRRSTDELGLGIDAGLKGIAEAIQGHSRSMDVVAAEVGMGLKDIAEKVLEKEALR